MKSIFEDAMEKAGFDQVDIERAQRFLPKSTVHVEYRGQGLSGVPKPYLAYLEGEPGSKALWDVGRTRAEAIGELLISVGKDIGVVIVDHEYLDRLLQDDPTALALQAGWSLQRRLDWFKEKGIKVDRA